METPQGPCLREKMNLLISAADALKLQLGVMSLVVSMIVVHQEMAEDQRSSTRWGSQTKRLAAIPRKF